MLTHAPSLALAGALPRAKNPAQKTLVCSSAFADETDFVLAGQVTFPDKP